MTFFSRPEAIPHDNVSGGIHFLFAFLQLIYIVYMRGTVFDCSLLVILTLLLRANVRLFFFRVFLKDLESLSLSVHFPRKIVL